MDHVKGNVVVSMLPILGALMLSIFISLFSPSINNRNIYMVHVLITTRSKVMAFLSQDSNCQAILSGCTRLKRKIHLQPVIKLLGMIELNITFMNDSQLMDFHWE